MRKRLLTLFILSFTLFLLLSGRAYAADEAQKAWLRMYATDSIYVGVDPDPWVEDSYVVYSGATSSISVDITVENFKGDRDVYEIVVPIVTNSTGVISSIAVNGTAIPSLDWTTGRLNMTADDGAELGELPPHGVYNDASAYWIEYRSGKNLTVKDTPGDSMFITVTIVFTSQDPDDVKIHLDAYGWIEESGNAQPVVIDDTLDAAFAPFSKDITIIVPELFLTLLTTTSLGLCGYLLLKRKTAKT